MAEVPAPGAWDQAPGPSSPGPHPRPQPEAHTPDPDPDTYSVTVNYLSADGEVLAEATVSYHQTYSTTFDYTVAASRVPAAIGDYTLVEGDYALSGTARANVAINLYYEQAVTIIDEETPLTNTPVDPVIPPVAPVVPSAPADPPADPVIITDIEDPQVPLADAPVVDIPDSQTPLADVPHTGDSSLIIILALVLLISAGGLTGIVLSGRKRRA